VLRSENSSFLLLTSSSIVVSLILANIKKIYHILSGIDYNHIYKLIENHYEKIFAFYFSVAIYISLTNRIFSGFEKIIFSANGLVWIISGIIYLLIVSLIHNALQVKLPQNVLGRISIFILMIPILPLAIFYNIMEEIISWISSRISSRRQFLITSFFTFILFISLWQFNVISLELSRNNTFLLFASCSLLVSLILASIKKIYHIITAINYNRIYKLIENHYVKMWTLLFSIPIYMILINMIFQNFERKMFATEWLVWIISAIIYLIIIGVINKLIQKKFYKSFFSDLLILILAIPIVPLAISYVALEWFTFHIRSRRNYISISFFALVLFLFLWQFNVIRLELSRHIVLLIFISSSLIISMAFVNLKEIYHNFGSGSFAHTYKVIKNNFAGIVALFVSVPIYITILKTSYNYRGIFFKTQWLLIFSALIVIYLYRVCKQLQNDLASVCPEIPVFEKI